MPRSIVDRTIFLMAMPSVFVAYADKFLEYSAAKDCRILQRGNIDAMQ